MQLLPFRRRRTRLLLLTPLLGLLYWHLHHQYSDSDPSSLRTHLRKLTTPPERQRKVGSAVPHETQETAQFQFHSPFREDPDVEFEAELDAALREIARRVRVEQGERASTGDGWPKKIWQVWLSKGWRPGDQDGGGFGPEKSADGTDSEDLKIVYMKQWKALNPDYEHTLLTDLTADHFVSTFYSSIPALVHLYRTLPLPVMKADLLRYLLLFAHGGVWVDHDIHPVRPLSTCPFPIHLPSESLSPHRDTTLLAGIEIDEPFVTPTTRTAWHWSRIYGLIQYHMVSKPLSPFLRRAVVRAVAHAYAHGKRKARGRGRGWPGRIKGGVWTGAYTEVEVLEITGPGVWTDAVLDTLTDAALRAAPPMAADLLDVVVDDAQSGHGRRERVTWRAFSGITTPREIVLTPAGVRGAVAPEAEPVGIVVLPVNYWGNGQRHSGAGNFGAKEACVNHLFLRSWKKGWWEWAFG